MKARTLVLSGVFRAFGAIATMAEEASYFGRFQALERAMTPGWNRDPSLVDTNNAGPSLTGRLIASRPLLETGEFAGIRLVMTMSEVVAESGKPPWVTGVCGIGRRFHYAQGINLVFREDRLGDRVRQGANMSGVVGPQQAVEHEAGDPWEAAH